MVSKRLRDEIGSWARRTKDMLDLGLPPSAGLQEDLTRPFKLRFGKPCGSHFTLLKPHHSQACFDSS